MLNLENFGRTGAKQGTFTAKNTIRYHVARIRERNPDASIDEVAELVAEQIARKDNLVNQAIEYAAFNHTKAAFDAEKSLTITRRSQQSSREALYASLKGELSMHIERKANVKLLEMMMPNGKPLRNCTGAEARGAGARFALIAQNVGDRELVGSKVTEKQARQIWDNPVVRRR